MEGQQRSLGKQAIVIGASMAGLTAARSLRDHFDQVLVVERDAAQADTSPRPGVPQGHHLHILIARGLQVLQRYFPRLDARLDEAKAPTIRWMGDLRHYLAGARLPHDDIGLVTRTATRPTLERIVREELAAFPNVSFLSHCQAEGLVTDAQKARVTGVAVAFRPDAPERAGQKEILIADFVVDASGRSSRLPEWLVALGYEAPPESEVNSSLGYCSRLYRRLSFEPDWKIFSVAPKGPDQPLACGISVQENGMWMALAMGYGRENNPPADDAGFLEFFRRMPVPDGYEALRTAEPLGKIHAYRRTANVRRHYERLTRFPARLAVLGDASSCFNPVYGQGMTVAALSAEALGAMLGRVRNLDALGLTFQKKLAKLTDNPWTLATGSDFQFRHTTGKRPGAMAKVTQKYFDRLQEMLQDPEIARIFMEVMHMTKEPAALVHPRLLGKVLAHVARRRA